MTDLKFNFQLDPSKLSNKSLTDILTAVAAEIARRVHPSAPEAKPAAAPADATSPQELLKRWRGNATKREAGRRLGYSATAIYNYERGKYPVPEKILERIATSATSPDDARRSRRHNRNRVLIDWRLAHKLTQKEAGDILGVSRGAISNYETGLHRTPAELIEKVNGMAPAAPSTNGAH